MALCWLGADLSYLPEQIASHPHCHAFRLWHDRFCRPRDQRHQMTSFILQFWIGIGVTVVATLMHLPLFFRFGIGIGVTFMRLPFLFQLGIGVWVAIMAAFVHF